MAIVLRLALLLSSVTLAAAAPADVVIDCDGCPQMVLIPGGVATLGSHPDTVDRSPGEGPKREVRIAYTLRVARHETTRAQWQEFVAATGLRYSYRGFAARGGQVYVRVL